MRAPAASVVQNPDSKLVVEIVAAFKLEDCLIAVSGVSLLQEFTLCLQSSEIMLMNSALRP